MFCNSLIVVRKHYKTTNKHDRFYREIGDRLGEANTLKAIGGVLQASVNRQRALEYYELALSLYRSIGSRWGEAITLQVLANLYHQLGRVREGFITANQAQTILQDLDLPLQAMPYPKWLKSVISFAKKGQVQFALCFVLGLIAFPLIIVALIPLFLWRVLRGLFLPRY